MFLRIRVEPSILKPLKCGSILSLPSGGDVYVMFEYEKLPDFCWICRVLNHQENDCPISMGARKTGGFVERGYGIWLRVETPNVCGAKFDGAEGSFSKLIGKSSCSMSERRTVGNVVVGVGGNRREGALVSREHSVTGGSNIQGIVGGTMPKNQDVLFRM
ncbi:Zinc knuckle CX2CX4HX4C [Corchorus olitorius]|uniref:Zinc knuckle CX2CX4HX4C n=1 Tax=Corchorus olitorius TaxID=93759 RepID=A0A1R3H0H4_9ROSI|nr:Zinc knuckle CX2CX4HX4C [Corchorus olitorius]